MLMIGQFDLLCSVSATTLRKMAAESRIPDMRKMKSSVSDDLSVLVCSCL